MLPTLAEYLELRPRFAVTRERAQRALAWAQPLAMEALGIHIRSDKRSSKVNCRLTSC